MTPPSTAPIRVIWAKPTSGIVSPSTASGTPAASAAAASAVVAAAATTPETRAARRTGWERVVRSAVGAVVRVVVMLDMGPAPLGATAPGGPLTPSTNAIRRIDTHVENFFVGGGRDG